MSYGIARIQKFSAGSVKGIEIHDLRAKGHSHTNKDIDFSRSDLNYELHLRNQEISFRQAVNERIGQLELKRAVRHDAKVMCQVLVTSDKEFFYEPGKNNFGQTQSGYKDSEYPNYKDSQSPNYKNPAKGGSNNKEQNTNPGHEEQSQSLQKQFFQDCYEFLCRRYGRNNIVSAVVHLDEKTPHMHVNFVPVTMDGRLSAKDVIGGRDALNRFQTQFYEQVFKGYGLERGVEGSKTRHQTIAEFKANTAKAEIRTLENEQENSKQKRRKLKGKFPTCKITCLICNIRRLNFKTM